MKNSFNTKAYTLSRLIKEVSNISKRDGSTSSGIYKALSPVLGRRSVKFAVLNKFLQGRLADVLQGHPSLGPITGSAKTPRTRLLNALRARKTSN